MFIEIVNAAQETGLLSSKLEFGEFVLIGISLIVLFAGIFSIGYILWGGVLLILSGGKDEKIKPAINSIRYALIGLIVIVVSIFVFPEVAKLLGLEVESYSNPDKIFEKIEVIGCKVFGCKEAGLNLGTPGTGDIKLDTDFTDL